ncbi:MAG: orotidine-5'-phosphate decarboxylase [Proteobacteria bacterium SW_6_67_9]|nr:MAG: orotidine-5'-phosphate decarboxylase [Proteobacteria bacterium SW_6_67_9]
MNDVGTQPRIIAALDYADPAAAERMVDALEPGLCRLKVGSELFTRAGPDWVARCMSRGFDVFLDLKFHDIPRTAAAACRAAADLGVWMVNVHALGGRAMLAGARGAIDAVAAERRPYLLGVTVLTSLGDADLVELGMGDDAGALAQRMADLAVASGCDGVVCSAREAGRLRQRHGDGIVLVTPGIRLATSPGDDQQRTLGPEEAVAAGADYLVVGRPITQAQDPVAALTDLALRTAGPRA